MFHKCLLYIHHTVTLLPFYSIIIIVGLSLIGTGTFGRVVLTRDTTGKSFYALKIMSISEVVRLKQVEHVNNEKEILSSIQHPFIVSM